MVRQKLRPQTMRATVRSAPTVRILVVVARPRGRTDVGYRTISRPLVESLRQATIRAEIDILPLGSYRALVQHLEAIRQLHGEGHYHVVHFDLHGALLTYPDIQHAIASNRYTYQARYAPARTSAHLRVSAPSCSLRAMRGRPAIPSQPMKSRASCSPIRSQSSS